MEGFQDDSQVSHMDSGSVGGVISKDKEQKRRRRSEEEDNVRF